MSFYSIIFKHNIQTVCCIKKLYIATNHYKYNYVGSDYRRAEMYTLTASHAAPW